MNLDRVFRIEQQTVVVKDFPAQGFILDIGGGGEGVIGQLKGAQIVAIDMFPRELEGTPAGPLKIIMDARELKFLEEPLIPSQVFSPSCSSTRAIMRRCSRKSFEY